MSHDKQKANLLFDRFSSTSGSFSKGGWSEKAAANESYIEKEVCRIQKVFYTETTEKVSGYRLNVEVDGEIISFTSNKSYNPGDLITLTKKISYSLN